MANSWDYRVQLLKATAIPRAQVLHPERGIILEHVVRGGADVLQGLCPSARASRRGRWPGALPAVRSIGEAICLAPADERGECALGHAGDELLGRCARDGLLLGVLDGVKGMREDAGPTELKVR
jgi:hypothetical protein